MSRVIGLSLSEIASARDLITRVLATHGKNTEVPYPDITTKEKAQQFIGLPMDQLMKEKEGWIKTILSEWDKNAKAREAAYPVQRENDKD
jgi:nitrite reductase (cytochrome c-552)